MTTRAQSLITTYFGRHQQSNIDSAREVSEIESNDIELLQTQMQICMAELDAAGLDNANVELFFSRIEKLQSRIQAISSSPISPLPAASTNQIDNNPKEFTDMTLLPIYYNNVRCITNKRNISMKIDLSVYKILCFTETWLTSKIDSSAYFPLSFNVYRYDRVNPANSVTGTRRSGGVAVIIHSDLSSRQVQLNQDAECECLAIEVKLKPIPLLLYVMYMREFDGNIASKHFKLINEMTTKFQQHRIMVLGDFNLHSIKWKADETNSHFLPTGLATHESRYFRDAADFLNSMLNLSLYQLSNIENAASNVLDLLFVDDYNAVKVSEDRSKIIEQSQQDVFHRPYEIFVEYSASSNTPRHEKISVFCYKRGNYQRMCRQLDNINFAHEFNTLDVESAFDYFYDVMKRVISNNIPKIHLTKNTNKPKWWTRELQRKKNRRDKLYKRKLKGADDTEYVAALNEFNDLNEKLHKEYVDEVQQNIASNPSAFWSYAKLKNKSCKYPNEMHLNESVASTPQNIVNFFADHFESSYTADEQHWSFDDIYHSLPSSSDINVTLFDIESAVNSLKWRAGVGPDEISPFVIKMCVESIVWPIWLLFQKTFEMGIIPERLKMSRVVPVFKKGDKNDVSNYRIVAISSTILKIFERAIRNKLTSIIEPKLSNAQHGFRSKRSITTNLMNLSIAVHESFSNGHQTDVFYGDFKNAFDKVWHRRLIEKLSTFNIGERTAKWLCEFVVGRRNYVKIGEFMSRTYNSPSGVPAGSTLGPILFSIYINDLVDAVKFALVLLFADDVKILKEITDANDTRMLQEDINNILVWCERNRLYFNNKKCAIFTASRSTSFIASHYVVGDYVIERKNDIRDLGVMLDRKFTFGLHIETITASARQMIGYIKRVSNGEFTMNTQKILYLAYVRPKLEFGSVIWNPRQGIYKDDIESIQKQFVIYLLENRRRATSFRLEPYCDRCKTLGFQNLEMRRDFFDCLFAYDVYVRDINDLFINSKIVLSNSVRVLRHVSLVHEPYYRNDYLRFQPIARIRSILNKYSDIVGQCNSRTSFKSKIASKLSNVNL